MQADPFLELADAELGELVGQSLNEEVFRQSIALASATVAGKGKFNCLAAVEVKLRNVLEDLRLKSQVLLKPI